MFREISLIWEILVYTCGVTTQGEAFGRGIASDGQLDNGLTVVPTTPALVSGGLKFQSLSAAETHNCGVTDLDIVYCWGQLGRSQGFGELITFPVSGVQ